MPAHIAVYFPGSTIGNMQPEVARHFLRARLPALRTQRRTHHRSRPAKITRGIGSGLQRQRRRDRGLQSQHAGTCEPRAGGGFRSFAVAASRHLQRRSAPDRDAPDQRASASRASRRARISLRRRRENHHGILLQTHHRGLQRPRRLGRVPARPGLDRSGTSSSRSSISQRCSRGAATPADEPQAVAGVSATGYNCQSANGSARSIDRRQQKLRRHKRAASDRSCVSTRPNDGVDRPERLRKIDSPAPDHRSPLARQRSSHFRPVGSDRSQRTGNPTPDRLRHPGRRPLSAPDRTSQRPPDVATPGLSRSRDGAAARGTLRALPISTGGAGSLSRRAFRRPTPARQPDAGTHACAGCIASG